MSVCSIKLLKKDADGKEFFECIYSPGTPSKFDRFVRKFEKIDRETSYSGRAVSENEFIFRPALWTQSSGGNSHPFTPQLAHDLKQAGVQGMVVAPISLTNVSVGKREAKLVFKIDVFSENGLVDNAPTRRALEFVVELCALVLQLALARGIISEAELERAGGLQGSTDEP